MNTSSKAARWAKIPEEIIRDDRLTLRQLRVLLALHLHKGKDSEVWPSRSVLADLTGFPENRISSITSELEALGWLEKHGDGGRSKATRYTLKTLPELVSVLKPETVTDMVRVSDPKTLPDLGRDTASPCPAEPYTAHAHLETLPDLDSDIAKTLPNLERDNAKTLPDLGSKTLPDLGRGIEQTSEQTSLEQQTKDQEQQTSGEFSPMTYDELMKASRVASRKAHIALHEERLRLSNNSPSDAAGGELRLLARGNHP